MSEDTFSSAIHYWKGIQLSNLQRELDQQGLAIVEKQKDGLVSRKKLAEQTREFKKIPDEEKLQKFKPLLKGYQAEIDNITKRTKYAENAFLTVYKLLADAPDPAPLFEIAVDQSAKMVDNTSLQNENSYLKEQLQKANESIKRLETTEKTNLELVQKVSALEESLTERKSKDTSEKEQEMKDQYSDKIKQLKEREYDLQKQLNQALDQLTDLRQSHDDTQAELIGHGQKYDEEVVGKLAELDIVTMDLERANGRIIQLEKKNEDLKEEMAKLHESKDSTEGNESAQHDAEVTKLIKDVETYKDMFQKTETRLSKKIKELTAENKGLSEERENLKNKMKHFDDYDEIKRELQIMKYVEFSTGEDEDDFIADDVLKKDGTIENSLEVRLMEKNKKLESEYTQIKVSFADLQKAFDKNASSIQSLEQKLQEKSALVQRLEEDLLRMGHKSNSDPNILDALSRSASGTPMPRTPDGALTPLLDGSSGSGGKKEDKSILPIVISQRDRFRQRNNELEERVRSLETSLQDARAEVQKLKADNLNLYERLKFVHVWKEGQQQDKGITNRSVAVNMDEPSTSMRSFRRSSIKQPDDPSDKYGKLYEESMNPFTQFHKKEENRRYNALNPAEKLTLNLTRLLFSHKWSRYFFIIYSLLLHLLVVVTLYQLSLWECRHDHEAINFPTNNDDAAKILNDMQ
ncbi:Golgi membrane protein [Mucor ambiguus]|uniref:Protein CASP n=1 Tax=Mucor ambiguus TaxID=91626 RepID=A0A0C9MR83_9FUNG|nr:Golgi membrane protein [Mucor ambiguus]